MNSFSVRTTDAAAAQQALTRRQADTRSGQADNADAGAPPSSFEAMMARHLKSVRAKSTQIGPEGDGLGAASGAQAATPVSLTAQPVPALVAPEASSALMQAPAQAQTAATTASTGEKEDAAATGTAGAASQGSTPSQAVRRALHASLRGHQDVAHGAAHETRRAARGDEVALDKNKDGKPGTLRDLAGSQAPDSPLAPLRTPESADASLTTASAPRIDTHGLEADRLHPAAGTNSASMLQAAAPAQGSSAPAPAMPAVQVQVAAPLNDPEFVQQFSSQVSILTQQGITHAELSINPPDMGPVLIEIRHQDNRVEVDFRAEMRETRQAIESSLGQLRDLLHDQGVELQDSWVRALTAAPVQDSANSAATDMGAGSLASQGDQARGGQGAAAGRDGQASGQGSQPSVHGSRSLPSSVPTDGMPAGTDGRRQMARPAAGLSLFA